VRNDKRGARTAIPFRPPVLLPMIFCSALLVQPGISASGPGDAILPLLEQMESSYAKVNDYQAIFRKQERVEGKLLPEETILLKFRKPLRIYMNWIGEPLKGQEALYVEGKIDNKLIAHRGGILRAFTLSLDPNGATAMEGNLHPITDTGFGFIIKQLRCSINSALRHGEFQIVRMEEEPFEGRPAIAVEAFFTVREAGKCSSGRMLIRIDREFMLPLGNVFHDEKGILFEKYSYTDVKLNVGFTDEDFSRSNEKYRF
jgi:outer membrane lipoprotein-sorting protein